MTQTQGEAEALLAWWQKELRLSDWRITLVFKRSWEIKDGSLGLCRAHPDRKTATIEVQCWEDSKDQEEDLEETLVHELLHLHTSGFHHPETGLLKKHDKLAMEAMVDLISVALVKGRRRNERERLEGKLEGLSASEALIRDVIAKIEGRETSTGK